MGNGSYLFGSVGYKAETMAITFITSKTKKGWGVYVRAISGDELLALRHKMPELKKLQITGAVPVMSGRLVLKSTEDAAQRKVKSLSQMPRAAQIEMVSKIWIKPLENKHFKLARLQYYQLHRDLHGKDIKQFTTQNKNKAESIALAYADIGVDAHLVKTVGRDVMLTHKEYDKVVSTGEIVHTTPDGLKGFTQPIKKQAYRGGNVKKTTATAFWKNK